MMLTTTYHCGHDRVERLSRIIAEIDLGEILYIFPNSNQHGITEHCITSTGILLIRVPEDGSVITGFMCTLERAAAMFRSQGFNHVPTHLARILINNEKKRKHLFVHIDC